MVTKIAGWKIYALVDLRHLVSSPDCLALLRLSLSAVSPRAES